MQTQKADSLPSSSKSTPTSGILHGLFISLGFIFGATFMATKVVVASLTPGQSVTLRLGLAFLVLLFGYRLLRIPVRLPAAALKRVWFAGILLQGIPLALFCWGMRYVFPGIAGIIEGSIPIFVFLIARLMVKQQEPLTRQSVLSLAIGIAGIVCVFHNKLHFSAQPQEMLGIGLLFLVVISFSIGTILNRRLLSGANALSLNAVLYHQNLSGFVFVILVTLGIEGTPKWDGSEFSWPVILGLLYVALFPTVIANYIYSRLIKEWGSVRTSAVGYLIPVTAFVFDFLFYGNLPTTAEWLGCTVILLGVFLLQCPEQKWRLVVWKTRQDCLKRLYLHSRLSKATY